MTSINTPSSVLSSGNSSVQLALLLRLTAVVLITFLIAAVGIVPGSLSTGFGVHPLAMFAVLLGGFWILHLPEFAPEHGVSPGKKQRLLAIIALVILWFVAIVIARLVPSSLPPSWVPADDAGWIGIEVSTSIRMSLAVLPLPAIFALFFSTSFLRRYHRWLLLVVGIALFYAWSSTLQFAFHHQAAVATMTIVGVILSLFSGDVIVSYPDYALTYNSATVFVSASCLGVNSIFLFIAAASVLWLDRFEKGGCDNRYAAGGLLAGILILQPLNVLRISLLVIADSVFPPFVSLLFHRSLGVTFLAAVFFAYLLFVLPLSRNSTVTDRRKNRG
jgi:exosortase/archaeosortase family protein